MATRENNLCDGLAALIDGQTFDGTTPDAFRAYRYQETLEQLANTAAGTVKIPVIPLSIPDVRYADRKHDSDTIICTVIVAASIGGIDNATVDPWSEVAQSVQDFLRGPTAYEVTHNGQTFTRRSSPTRPAPSDAGWLEQLVFASQIAVEYSTGVSRK